MLPTLYPPRGSLYPPPPPHTTPHTKSELGCPACRLRLRTRVDRPLWFGPRFHSVAAHFGILGFPGEGPPRFVARNPRGINGFVTEPPTRTPPPPTPQPTARPGAQTPSSSESCADKGGRPIRLYTAEWVQEQVEADGGYEMLAARLNEISRTARKWQRQATATQAEVKGGGTRLPNSSPSMEQQLQQRRVARVSVNMCSHLFGRPAVDQAKAVNDMIETCLSRETRLLLREQSYVQRERFVAVRWAVGELNGKWWTAHNWLELRLKKFLSMRVITVGVCGEGVP